MATYFVNVAASAFGGFGGDPVTVLVTPSGSGVSQNSSSPILLTAGDTVGFKYTSNSNISSIRAELFSSAHFTNTSTLTLTTSYQYKTVKSGVSTTVNDVVRIKATANAGGTAQKNIYFLGNSPQPDRTISITNTNIEIATSASQFAMSFTNSGSSTNSSITQYRVKDSAGTAHETRTGPGTITVTDVPPNAGFPKTYSIDARVPTGSGGSGLFQAVPSSTFDVTATTTAVSNNPNIDAYGMAIYDGSGTAVTSFAGGHSILREIFTSTVTLSTSGYTNVNTGLTGISTSNCIISLEGNSGSGTGGVDRVPATFVTISGTIHVRLGRHTSADTAKVTVSQYNGSTIGSSGSYGWSIVNGDSQVVLDENSVTYGVKEVISLNSGLSTQTLFQNDECFFLYVELVQGRYPVTAGLPVPALSCSKSVVLMPPMVSALRHNDGSYKTVLIYLSKAVAVTNYKLAMLVTSDVATPSYYAGSADSYGTAVYNSSNSLIWHSGWRQAIVNNVINANQFTSGTNQNGTYDVTTGRDGVLAPVATTADFNLSLLSRSENKVVSSGVNDMDPANSYIAGTAMSGRVSYYKGLWDESESGTSEQFGGGLHRPGIRINSSSSVTLQMYRYSNGPTAPSSGSYGARVSTSFHPEGSYVIFRIV